MKKTRSVKRTGPKSSTVRRISVAPVKRTVVRTGNPSSKKVRGIRSEEIKKAADTMRRRFELRETHKRK